MTVGSSSFPDLLNDAINAEAEFAVLDNRDSIYLLDYAGVENAMRFTINAAGTQADFEIPIIEFRRVFIAADREELDQQIEDFLKDEGADVYQRFLEAINRSSLVAISDGNPSSTTAIMSQTIFEEVGFGGDESITEALQAAEIGQRNSVGLMAILGRFKARDFDGRYYSLPLSFGHKFTDRIRAKFNIPLVYQEVEDAQIFNAGLMISIPFTVIGVAQSRSSSKNLEPGDRLSRLRWDLAPTAGLAAGGSPDYAAGSVMYVGALTSMLSYDFEGFKLTMGNHLSFLEGQTTDVDGYEVGGDVSQQILKNGLKLSVPFQSRWTGEIYGIHTKFLEDAAVEDFVTVGAQVGIRLFSSGSSGNTGVIILGVVGDFGDDYDSWRLRLGSGFRF